MFGTVFTKTLRDQRRGLIGWGTGIVATVALMAAIWPSFSDVDYESLLDQYPEAMKEIFNIGDMGTATGFMNAELYSLLLPALFIVFAIGRGARLVAGEEEEGTLETLAALPVSRDRVLLEKAAALAVALAVLALALFVSSALMSAAIGMGIPLLHLLNAAVAMYLLGFEFGFLALAVSAGTGRRGLAIGAATAVAAASYLLFVMGQLVEAVEPLLELSPFHQAVAGGPIGATLPAVALAMPLVGLLALAAALPVFHRRDLAV